MKKKEKSQVSWLAEFAGAYRMQYAVSISFAAAGVLCGLAPYFIIGDLVGKLIGGNKMGQVYLQEGLVMAVFWVGRVIFHSLSTSFSHRATFYVLANMRKQVCDKLARAPLGRVMDTPSGSLKNITVERIDSIETILAHVVPEFTANLLAPLCVFLYLWAVDWRMALASLITLPLGMLAYMGMMIGYEESFQNTVTKTKILNDTAVEYINGIEVIKAFGRAQNSHEKFKVAAREGASCYVEWMRRCNVYFSLAMVLMPCTAVAVLPIGGWFVMKGSLSAADFVLCIVLSLGLISPLITVMSYTDDLGKLRTVVGEVTEVLSWEELSRPEKDEEPPKNFTVTLENVTFAYQEKEVLHGIDMEIREGAVTAFVGPSGSGKSTIARLIASLWDVKEGSIRIGGVDIRRLSLQDYYQKVAYVSQDNYLFNDTVRENIRMGRPDASDGEVEEAAKRCGCHDFIMSLEKGYDTVVGGGGGHLSGGERQRITIARAMLKDAPIVILDEATANVDPENERELVEAIEALTREKTIFMIAHRLKTVRNADLILVVDRGRIVQKGRHEELMEQEGICRRFVQSRELAASWKL